VLAHKTQLACHYLELSKQSSLRKHSWQKSFIEGEGLEVFLEDGVVFANEEGCDEEVCDSPGGEEIATSFGFMEITRGSVIPGTLGFNPTSGEAAVVSIPTMAPVPLPAAGWMLLAGFGGMAAMKRRKKT